MARHKKTQAQIARRNALLGGLWAGLFAGIIIGYLAGGFAASRNVLVSDLEDMKAEIRVTVKEMKMEQIKMDKLVQTIQGWQMEIDEVWLYYGTNLEYKTRAMSSEEGRPSGKD